MRIHWCDFNMNQNLAKFFCVPKWNYLKFNQFLWAAFLSRYTCMWFLNDLKILCFIFQSRVDIPKCNFKMIWNPSMSLYTTPELIILDRILKWSQNVCIYVWKGCHCDYVYWRDGVTRTRGEGPDKDSYFPNHMSLVAHVTYCGLSSFDTCRDSCS